MLLHLRRNRPFTHTLSNSTARIHRTQTWTASVTNSECTSLLLFYEQPVVWPIGLGIRMHKIAFVITNGYISTGHISH